MIKDKSLSLNRGYDLPMRIKSFYYDWLDPGVYKNFGLVRTEETTSPPYPALVYTRNRNWKSETEWLAEKELLGYSPTRPYSDVFEHIEWIPGRIVEIGPFGPSREIYGNTHFGISASLGFDSALLSRVSDEAKISALLRAKDMKVNLAVMFGEGRKTVQMILKTASTVAQAYIDVRRGRFKQAAKRLGIAKPSKSAANNWLALKYGWLPLLSDIKGLAELAAQQVVGRPRFRVSAWKRREAPMSATYSNGLTDVNHGSNRREGLWEYTSRAGLLLEVQPDSSTAALSQTGIIDPALLAWELVPFSFVFDWMISVGTWLQLRTALSGLKVLNGYSLTIAKFEGEHRYVETLSSAQVLQLPRAEVQYRQFSRQPWDGNLDLMSRAFVQKDPLGISKLITYAALWRQRL